MYQKKHLCIVTKVVLGETFVEVAKKLGWNFVGFGRCVSGFDGRGMRRKVGQGLEIVRLGSWSAVWRGIGGGGLNNGGGEQKVTTIE